VPTCMHLALRVSPNNPLSAGLQGSPSVFFFPSDGDPSLDFGGVGPCWILLRDTLVFRLTAATGHLEC
jgi:hypothetical protein